MLDIQDVMDELEARYSDGEESVIDDIVSMNIDGISKEEIVAKYPMSDDEWDCLKADMDRSILKWQLINELLLKVDPERKKKELVDAAIDASYEASKNKRLASIKK